MDTKAFIGSLVFLVIFAPLSIFAINLHQSEVAEVPVICCTSPAAVLVVEAAKDNRSVFLSNVWATMGFLIAAIGWMLSSDKARNYLRDAEKARRSCLYSVVILAVFHVAVLFDAYFESEAIISQLKSPCQGLSYFVVRKILAQSSSVVNGVLFLLLWFLIFSQHSSKENGSSEKNSVNQTHSGGSP